MYTPEGLAAIWEIAAGRSQDSIQTATIRVLDGDNEPGEAQEASAPLDSSRVEVNQETGAARLILVAIFGPDDANFDWRVREVVSALGVVIDRTVEDGGRKVPGSIWTLEAALELAPS